MMSEQLKTWIKIVITVLISAVGAARTAITASGTDNFAIFQSSAGIWFDMFLAVGPVILANLTKSPAQGAAMDRAIEMKADAKADAKVDARVQNMLDTGTLRMP